MTWVGRKHSGRWANVKPADRLMAKVDIDPVTGCWNWNRALNNNGYASGFSFEGKSEMGHRASYMIFVGPIPDGHVLDHLCRNRACLNPEHLEPVLIRENHRRGINGELTTACPQGHAYTPENTRVEHTRRGHRLRHCRECARVRERARKSRAKAAA